MARPLVCVLFLVNQPNYSVTARPYCCAWSAGIVSGLGASTFSHGPFTVGAACSVPSKVTVTVPSPLFTTLSAGVSARLAQNNPWREILSTDR